MRADPQGELSHEPETHLIPNLLAVYGTDYPTFERFDARPGGSYRLVLAYNDDSSGSGKASPDADIVEARFVDVVPNVRVVQAVDFVSDAPAFAGTMTMTWELSVEHSGPRVEIRADDVPGGLTPEDHAVGMQSSLANLATFVETRRP